MPLYSVVIPCYKSSKTIGKVVETTAQELRRLGIDAFEFVLVNDCSPDGGATRQKLFELAEQLPYVRAIDLGKNSGQHNATMAALNYASGDFIICMDDDGQSMPSEIGKLLDKLNEGYDIVYGYPQAHKESLFRRFGSKVNDYTVRLLIGKPKGLKASSFWVIRRYVRDYAIQYVYPSVHLQGIFLRITSSIACLPVQRREREIGSSGYTFKKLLGLYSNIIGFSQVPLTLVRNVGFVFALAGFITVLVVLIRKLINPAIPMGWTSVFGSIYLCTGILMIALGVVGSYIGRLYLGQTRKPQFTIREMRNIDRGAPGADAERN